MCGPILKIRKTVVSIVSNITEAFDIRLDKELLNFLTIAHGSTVEVQNNLHFALEIQHIFKTDVSCFI